MRELLESDAAADLLSAALATRGRALDEWRMERVHSRPGAETSVGYEVVSDGKPTYLVASTADLTERQRAAAGAVRLESTEGVVYVWVHPADPELPQLRVVCDADRLAARLAAIPEPVMVNRVELVALRPMRRAVVRVDGARDGRDGTWWIKVLRPARSAEVRARYLSWSAAPRAEDLGDGALLIASAAGRSLATHLYRSAPDAQSGAITADEISAFLDDMPESTLRFKARRPWAASFHQHADVCRTRGVAETLVDDIVRAVDRSGALEEPRGPVVPTHGDLTVANLFVDASAGGTTVRPVSAIDVDTLGPGHRIDDYACLVAHLAALPALDSRYLGAPTLALELVSTWAREGGGTALTGRAAAVLLSLASSCMDVSVSDQWVEAAAGLAFSDL